ncbi:hypothetical protein L3Q65_00460 (plasmid) [Amycolatopsis sp. FU40]|uniref:hypothetical protein n=1 Tax=Amycolatopsis sp. FU40 TaxID=2914159 RepID=UPI001F3E83B5|nr:hypothetical protein [Amycolatopsis sp. FU40]UKD50800.1 hypothetical protein L3Q65_00460 [Amycolatopsis sp. FU40]
MTRSYLDLSIAIGKPVDELALLRECRRLLGTPDSVPPIKSRTESPLYPNGHARIAHPVFWDFPAALAISWGIDGPMIELPREDATDAHRRSLKADPVTNGWAAAEVQLKPFVGWPEIARSDARDCDLGAWLIRELGRWLDGKRLPWQWEANGASVYIPYSTGSAKLALLGDASVGAVTPETVARINKRFLAEWQRGWRGRPDPWEGVLLQGWRL